MKNDGQGGRPWRLWPTSNRILVFRFSFFVFHEIRRYTVSVEPLFLVLCLLGGLVIGAIVGIALTKGKIEPEKRLAEAKTAEAEAARTELTRAREERATFEAQAQQAGVLQTDLKVLQERLESHIAENNRLNAQIEGEREARLEERKLLDQARTQLEDAFKALSSDALRKNNQQFIELAQQTFNTLNEKAKGDLDKRSQVFDQSVKDIQEKLKTFDENIKGIEKDRVGAYEQLKEQVKGLADSQKSLQTETNNLVRALSNTNQRGKWGELQLETILKHAGLVEGINYRKQVAFAAEEGGGRPDFVVRFPSGHEIVIDSKVPLDAYYEANVATDDGVRNAKLKEHAQKVRQHATALGQRGYQDRFESLDFVVMFLPAESLFSVAVQHDPSLIEFGLDKKVFIASPITLIGVLRSVAMGWRQEKLAENAKQISDEAKELYTRIATFGDKFNKLRSRLDGAVGAFNETAGSLEARVLPQARRLKELNVTTAADIPTMEPIERVTRELQSPELKSMSASSEETEVTEDEDDVGPATVPVESAQLL